VEERREGIENRDNRMFDKKNKRSTSQPRDDSPEYGFDRRSDLAKLYWDGPRTNNQKVTTSGTEYETFSANNLREKNGDRAYENSNVKYKSSAVTARKENNKSFVPFNFRPASSMGMGSFQSPVSPASKYEKHSGASELELENSSLGSKQEPYSRNHTTSGNGISIYENSSMPYKHNTSYISSRDEKPESYKRTSKEQYNSSKEQYNSSKEQYNSSKEQYNSPKEQYNSSKEQYNSPKEQYNSPKEQYNSPKEHYNSAKEPYSLYRPISTLAMGSFQSPVTPTAEYAKQRRGSVSDFEENSIGQKFKTESSYLRRKSVDVPPDGFDKYQQRNKSEKVAKYDINKNGKNFFTDDPSSTSGNIWPGSYKTGPNTQYEPQISSTSSRGPISRSDAFDAATRFDDTIRSSCNLPTLPICDDYNQPNHPARQATRQRHKTLPYGVAKDDLDSAKSTTYSNGSNEDLERVLRELDNTGYFSETIPSSSRLESQNGLTAKPRNKNCQNGEVDYKKLWEESQTENTRLRLQLGEVKNELESVRAQLEAMAIQAINNKSLSEAEKREKIVVLKKLEEMEEELKLLAYSENLTDQTLNQLRADNSTLREENQALMRVMSRISK